MAYTGTTDIIAMAYIVVGGMYSYGLWVMAYISMAYIVMEAVMWLTCPWAPIYLWPIVL